jgi:hypothetical protein
MEVPTRKQLAGLAGTPLTPNPNLITSNAITSNGLHVRPHRPLEVPFAARGRSLPARVPPVPSLPFAPALRLCLCIR